MNMCGPLIPVLQAPPRDRLRARFGARLGL